MAPEWTGRGGLHEIEIGHDPPELVGVAVVRRLERPVWKSTDPTRLRLSRKEVRHDPDARAQRRPHDAAMVETRSYAVAWTEAGSRFVGHALLAERGLRLEGRDASAHEGLRSIRFDDIVAVELRRANGHRTLVIAVAGDDELLIASLDRPGSLGELAERLRLLTDSPQR